MNYKTVADAIAARFVDVVATNGTETETATATADLPDTIAKGPVLLVYPPFGSLRIIPGPRLEDVLDFPVKLLRDPLTVAVRGQWLLAWATALRTGVQQKVQLGVPGVLQAEAIAIRAELDGEKYAGIQFDVVELTVRVWIVENTTAAV